MKHLILFLALCVMAVTLSSCSDGYVVGDDMVTYEYWTFSFGTRYDTLPGADPATFKPVNKWLGHDSQRVYYLSRLVPGVDVATLKAVRKPVFKDKNDYYYETSPVHVADMKSFKILKWAYGSFWAKDALYAYFDTMRIQADVKTFKVLNPAVAKDKSHVYYFGDIIPDADPATFKPIGNSIYNRDKSHIWCGDELLQDADYETFEVDGSGAAHDKFGAFTFETRDTIPE